MHDKRTEIENELREILSTDNADGQTAADMMIAHRQRLAQQIGAQAFARRSAKHTPARRWSARTAIWLAGAGGAVATVLVIVLASIQTSQQQHSAQQHIIAQTQRPTASQSSSDEGADVDALVRETLASVDEVWERGEQDIDRLISDRSGK